MKHQIKTQVYFFNESEGGRNTPFGSGFNPKIKFDGSVEELFTSLVLEDDEVIFSGDNVKLKLIVKGASEFYLYQGASFELFEGDKKIGEGSVLLVE